ncbi:MAG TPA: alpha/beta hydrolase [Burkholderiaceae bacterium]
MPDAAVPLEPQLAEMARRWKDSGIPGLYEGGDPSASRERGRCIRAFLYPSPTIEVASIDALEIPGADGPLPARIVRPHGAVRGTVVFFHGGGWVLGDLQSHEAHCRRIAAECGVVVLNVGYRLAPEHRFPAAAMDAMAALDWAFEHVGRLGGAALPVAVAGDSAGGNLAAVAALHARARGLPLAAQLLIYPATDMSRRLDADIARAYFGERVQQQASDWRASPALAERHAGLAPAIIGVGAHDFLYEDNLAYAARLQAAGVPVLLRQYPALNHGFFSFTRVSPGSLQAAQQLCADLRGLLEPGVAR